jgi:hypothetical protein
MAAPENKKPKCATVIPREWPQLTGPKYVEGMTAAEGRALWYAFLRQQAKVGRNPQVPRSI